MSYPFADLPTPDPSTDRARICGGCTLCCKLPAIESLAKPANVWCPDCAIGTGCRIYAIRPDVCRTFRCGWLAEADMPEHWWPARSRMIVMREATPRRLSVHVDPGRADAWRAAPFIDDLVGWATDLVPQGIQVVVQAPPRLFGILPTGPVDLGQSAVGGELILENRPDATGQPRWRYRRLPLTTS